MALLDRSFRGKCTPEILTFQRVADIQKGEGDLRVELSESELARYIYTYLHINYSISTHIYIIYTLSTHIYTHLHVQVRVQQAGPPELPLHGLPHPEDGPQLAGGRGVPASRG